MGNIQSPQSGNAADKFLETRLGQVVCLNPVAVILLGLQTITTQNIFRKLNDEFSHRINVRIAKKNNKGNFLEALLPSKLKLPKMITEASW